MFCWVWQHHPYIPPPPFSHTSCLWGEIGWDVVQAHRSVLSRFSLSSNKLWPAVFVFWTPPGNPLSSRAQATDESGRLPWVNTGRLINSSWLDYQASDCSVETSLPSLPFPSHRVFLSSEMFGVGMSPWTDKTGHGPWDVAESSHALLPVGCSQGLIFLQTKRFQVFLLWCVKVTLNPSRKPLYHSSIIYIFYFSDAFYVKILLFYFRSRVKPRLSILKYKLFH